MPFPLVAGGSKLAVRLLPAVTAMSPIVESPKVGVVSAVTVMENVKESVPPLLSVAV